MTKKSLALFLACSIAPPMAAASRATASDRNVVEAASETGTTALVGVLTERGMSQDEAKAVVDSLTADDIQVLTENPEMLQAAGDGTDTMAAVGIILLILLLIGAAAAA